MKCELCQHTIQHAIPIVDGKGTHLFCSIPCSEEYMRHKWNTIREVGFDNKRKRWVCRMQSGDTAFLPLSLFQALIATCPCLPYRLTGKGELVAR